MDPLDPLKLQQQLLQQQQTIALARAFLNGGQQTYMSSPNNAIAQGFPTNPESTSPTIKADTRLVGANKRVFYVNRKVAIMEEVHMKNSGRSLQEQMNRVQKILKTNVQKVGHLEERGATQGDIDALARQKCDVSEVNLMSQRIESRIREGLNEKYDATDATKALKKKVNLADLKERVKAFVTPVVYTIIGEKLPEAVEETKNGLVQLVKRMFDVDPEQRADMENVSRLIKQNEAAMENAKTQAKTHAVEVTALKEQVAEAIAEVRATAADKLKEQTDMMKGEMNGMLKTMTDTAEKIQEDTLKRVMGAVGDLKTQNAKVLAETQQQITESYTTFVSKATDVHEKFKVELDLKYQKDIGSMTSRVERCVEQCKEMTGFFKTIKGRMKELQSAQQQVNLKVEAMETMIGSVESKFDTITADTQDLRNDNVIVRKDLGVLENALQQVTKVLDSTKTLVINVEANAQESRNAITHRLDVIKNGQKDKGSKNNAKFKNVESKMKNAERQASMAMANQEKLLLDQVRSAAQHEASDLRDVKAAIDRRFVEMTSELRAKDREIGSLRKQDLATERQVKRIELKLQEGEDKTSTIEKKVKKMHASSILNKVLNMMQPKGKNSPMGNKLLKMAALQKANAELVDIQSVNTGWSNNVEGGGDAAAAAALNSVQPNASNNNSSAQMTNAQQSEMNAQISIVGSSVHELRTKYADLKIQVDDEMMMERQRHEAHLTQMKEDLKARHDEELEIQRQDWEERTVSMREQYESQLGRIHDTHSKVQDQLHEAHAVTSVLQAHKMQAEEMMANNTMSNSMSILSNDESTESSTHQQALEEHSRQVAKAHENFHREILTVKEQHSRTREDMKRQIEEAKVYTIETAKLAALEHADKHIKAMLSEFANTAQREVANFSAEETTNSAIGMKTIDDASSSTTTLINSKGGDGGALNSVIMTSQKHQDHRIDILLKKQLVEGREIGLLRQALLELEEIVVRSAKTGISNTNSPNRHQISSMSSPTGKGKSNNNGGGSMLTQIENAAENARMALIGVATEANDAMKRVVAQTSRVEAFVRKHENEDRRLRAEQEYKHLKEVQQTQRLNQAHKMKSLLDEQKNSNEHQKTVDKLEQENQRLRNEFNANKQTLLSELKQTRQEKQTAQMMAQRLSEKQTAQRMQEASLSADGNNESSQQIGNFIGRGGALRSYSRAAEEFAVREVLPEDTVPVRVQDADVTLQQSLEIIGARTPNVPYTASEVPTDGRGSVATTFIDHGFDQQLPMSAQSGSQWSDRPPSGMLSQRRRDTPTNGISVVKAYEEIAQLKEEAQRQRKDQEQQLNSTFANISDKLGEVDFERHQNRSLITAMNERFIAEVNGLKKQLSYVPNIGAMEAQIQQLMSIVSQVQTRNQNVTDLKIANSSLENELKRRSPTYLKNGGVGAGREGPSSRARRVIQLANSQSDPNLVLPQMFNLQ